MKRLIVNISAVAFLSFFLFSLSSCKDDDDDLTQKEEDLYEKYVTPELESALDKLGMTINRGIDPPNITGYFYMEEPKCTAVTQSDDGMLNKYSYDKKLRFYDKKELSISMEGWELDYEEGDNVLHEAKGVFLCGEGDKFSIFFNEEFKYDSGAYGTLFSIYSGEVEKSSNGNISGLKNLQYAILMRENNDFDGIMPNGDGRLFQPKDVRVITKSEYESLGNTLRSLKLNTDISRSGETSYE
ncbi:MAG: hypothetical protein LBV72_03815 [Tannerella sp.]|jgi:hypothetical protein|nr:hypothetical protein [Tannerella sp.]